MKSGVALWPKQYLITSTFFYSQEVTGILWPTRLCKVNFGSCGNLSSSSISGSDANFQGRMLFFPETYQLRLGTKPNVQVSPLPLISEFDFMDRREQSWNTKFHSTLNQNSYWENFINTRKETSAVCLYRKWWKLGQSPTRDNLQEQSKPVLTVNRCNSVQLLAALLRWQVSRKRCAEHYLTNSQYLSCKEFTKFDWSSWGRCSFQHPTT